MNVNISTRTLTTPFDVTVLDVLAETGLPPDRLRLELPETADLTLLSAPMPASNASARPASTSRSTTWVPAPPRCATSPR